MINYIVHKNINKQKWDACIASSEHVSVFVYSWYLDAVCDNWCAFVLNDYEAVFPVAIKSKYGIKYVYQPFFTRYFGLFSKNKITTQQQNDFLNAISQKFKYIDFCLHESYKSVDSTIQTKEKKYQYLDLGVDYRFLQKGFSTNALRNIKKAEKNNFKISTKITPEEIVDLFKKTKGGELTVFKPKDYKLMVLLMEQCRKNKQGEAYAVLNEKENILAAAFFIKTKGRFVFLKSGVTDTGKEKGAMHFLFNEFIKKYADSDTVLDFGGSTVDSVARFYKNFGAKDCVYLQLKQNKLPKLLKLIKK